MMPAPALWSVARAAWHTWLTYAAAMTAPPPLPQHIRRDAIVHCVGVGTVQVDAIDTAYGIATVRQPTGNPWVAPYSALTEASRAETYDFQAEADRRAPRGPRLVQDKGKILPFPPRPNPSGPSAAQPEAAS
jgi:hypothetical protein